MTNEVLGYRAVVEVNTAPMFCTSCGSDVNREVEALTEDDLTAFDTASCAICGQVFYAEAGTFEVTLPEDVLVR